MRAEMAWEILVEVNELTQKIIKKYSGGDATYGNTRSHTEHDG